MKPSDFTYSGKKDFKLSKKDTKIDDIYASTEQYESMLLEVQEKLNELQNILYAHGKYGILVIFQAMDAAGKDGTMAAVFKNVNPLGLSFMSFKRPTETEIAHDYLWRCFSKLPERGKVQVFNRSYYEEVLVVKVHPSIVHDVQQIPDKLKTDDIWDKRYADIRNFEEYLQNNGIEVIKFFLNVSKKEQGERLIARIEDPEKHWKFDDNDIKERQYWNQYQDAYQTMIEQTATETCPWHIIPADDKKNMRLLVGQTLVERMKALKLAYPETTPERAEAQNAQINVIKEQDKDL
jgi:PPK2 family polyphosphate:nucleotide phosphotransferase